MRYRLSRSRPIIGTARLQQSHAHDAGIAGRDVGHRCRLLQLPDDPHNALGTRALPPRDVRCLPHPHSSIKVRCRHHAQVHPATLALSQW